MKSIKTVGNRNPNKIIDRVIAGNVRVAEANFMERNNFKKLLEKSDITILKSERYYQ